MPRWNFREMQASEKWHEPNEGEFFRGDPVAAVLREAIQNSLDAVDSAQGERVRVRFFVSGAKAALPVAQARTWLSGLDEHLKARDLPLALIQRASVPFLTFEDFGTTGLVGNPMANRPPSQESEKNHFFFFWRALGSTGKGSSERGSWGVGKSTYQYVSAIRTFFGLTVRSNDDTRSALLMGEAWLGPHNLGDTRYDSFGAFGEFLQPSGHDPNFVTPTELVADVAQFRNDFHLERRDESGFSCVIPFPFDLHDDTEDETTLVGDLAEAAIRHFAVPILAGRLRIDLATPDALVVLDGAVSMRSAIDGLRDNPKAPDRKPELKSAIELATWALGPDVDDCRIELVSEAERDGCGWPQLKEPAGKMDDLRSRFLSGQPVAIRIPVTVRFKDSRPNVICPFDVFLQSTDLKKPVVHYVRHDLGISEVRGGPTGNVVALVNVENNELASLLRAAENPAHTTWKPEFRREDRLTREYIGGEQRIKLVIDAPKVLLGRLLASTGKPDFDLLAQFFPVPVRDGFAKKKDRGPKKGEDEKHPSDKIKRVLKPLVLTELADGFTFTRDPSVPLKSKRFAFRVAYDIADGNPFKQWEKFDFELGRHGIRCECVGGTKQIRDNEITAVIRDDSFRLSIRGFPPDRDVVVETPRWPSDKKALSEVDVENEEEV